jgi:hypothetical protein
MKIIIKSLVYFSLLYSSHAIAWGERGHNTVGYVAALATSAELTPEEKAKIGDFFVERAIMMGHLNNIPDISWKDAHHDAIKKINPPTHYLDSEMFLGAPTNGYDETYLKRIRGIEKDYKKLEAQFNGKPPIVPTAAHQKTNIFFDAGSAPWRVQEFYDLMVYALVCANSKPYVKGEREHAKVFREPFTTKNGKTTYICRPNSTRFENIYAAVVFAGVMGHYVGDLSQPFHASADFNGWTTGQGGVHWYYETAVVQALDEEFRPKVVKIAADSAENKKIWERVSGGDPKDKTFAIQTMLNLAADSMKHFDETLKADREVALIKEGDKTALAAAPGKILAQRKPPNDEKVIKKFEPMIIERIATSAVVLSRLWVEAWRQAGRPDLSDVTAITIPYPLDVPFITPGYTNNLMRKEKE